MKTTKMLRVYVWEFPVRLFHWVNALAILVLCATGILIATPPAVASAEEASFNYWFGINRFVHFVAAYVFTFNYLIRFYWSFVGNKWAHWSSFLPISKDFIKEILHVLKVDIMLLKGKPHVAVGHNALAAVSYFAIFLLVILQVVTGFALYADTSEWWFPKLFALAIPFFGGDLNVRFIHHITMWAFIIFTIIHIYLVLFHELTEGRGEISAMSGGWKFMEEEVLEEERLKEHDEIPDGEKLEQEDV